MCMNMKLNKENYGVIRFSRSIFVTLTYFNKVSGMTAVLYFTDEIIAPIKYSRIRVKYHIMCTREGKMRLMKL